MARGIRRATKSSSSTMEGRLKTAFNSARTADAVSPKSSGKNLTEGAKFDGGKLDWTLLPPESIEEVIAVYMYGCKKYERNNWRKGILYSRIFAAIMRHLWAWWKGEDEDKESGLRHLAQAAFGCLTLLEYSRLDSLGYSKYDDRRQK